MHTTDVIWACIASIIGAIVLYTVIGRVHKIYGFYKQRKRNQNIVQDLLQTSISQRGTFRLEVMQGEFKGLCAEGICSNVGAKFFSLQVTNAFGVHKWVSVPITMFFPVSKDGVPTFYHFSAVAHAADRRENFTELTFALPPAITPGQNRAFLRFAPPKPLIRGVDLWLMQGSRPLPLYGKELPEPFLQYQAHGNTNMVLENISAGGMRIFIHEHGMGYNAESFKPGSHLLFFLTLVSKKKKDSKKIPLPQVQNVKLDQAGKAPMQGPAIAQMAASPMEAQIVDGQVLEAADTEEQWQNQSFWLSCRVRSLVHAEQDKLWQMSVRFEAWALLKETEEGAEKNAWFPTDADQSVPPLATWIMRAHMEQTKKI